MQELSRSRKSRFRIPRSLSQDSRTRVKAKTFYESRVDFCRTCSKTFTQKRKQASDVQDQDFNLGPWGALRPLKTSTLYQSTLPYSQIINRWLCSLEMMFISRRLHQLSLRAAAWNITTAWAVMWSSIISPTHANNFLGCWRWMQGDSHCLLS